MPPLARRNRSNLLTSSAAHLSRHRGNAELEARLGHYELAARMQTAVPEVLDLSKESDATLALNGLERGSTKWYAWQCIMARRLIENGVRFTVEPPSSSQLAVAAAGHAWYSRPGVDAVRSAASGP